MKTSTAVFTVIFPANLPLLKDFITSLNKQTFSAFEVVVANDGVSDPDHYLKDLAAPYRVLPVAGTPPQIREQGIDFLRREEYPYLVFADSDDAMSVNRIEESVRLLQDHGIVCNDLDLIDHDGTLLERDFWSTRLSPGAAVDAHFLADKNIVGLGNAAIRAELLTAMDVPSHLTAVDWFLFYQWVGRGSAIFTNACKTLYRQHAGNTIGLKRVDRKRLENVISAKKIHYTALLKQGFALQEQLEQVVLLESKLKRDDFLEESLALLNSKGINYFWWEETNYLV